MISLIFLLLLLVITVVFLCIMNNIINYHYECLLNFFIMISLF